MKVRNVNGIDKNESKWLIDCGEHYSQLCRKDNWYTFTALQLEFENDWIMGNYELIFIVLGLGFRISYHHLDTETAKELKRNIDIMNDDSSVVLSAAEYDRLK